MIFTLNILKMTSREENPFKGHYLYFIILSLTFKRALTSLKINLIVNPFALRGSFTLLNIYFNIIAL